MAIRCRIFSHDWGEWSGFEESGEWTVDKREHGEKISEVDYVRKTKSRECFRCGKVERKSKEEKREERGIEEVYSHDQGESLDAHLTAGERTPPVALGQVVRGGVEDFSEHHSGRKDAIIRHQGFVIFVKGVPAEVRPLDMVRAKVTSFNRGNTSANAHLVEVEG